MKEKKEVLKNCRNTIQELKVELDNNSKICLYYNESGLSAASELSTISIYEEDIAFFASNNLSLFIDFDDVLSVENEFTDIFGVEVIKYSFELKNSKELSFILIK